MTSNFKVLKQDKVCLFFNGTLHHYTVTVGMYELQSETESVAQHDLLTPTFYGHFFLLLM